MSQVLYGVLKTGAKVPSGEEVRAAVEGASRGRSMATLEGRLAKTRDVEKAGATEWLAGPLLVDVLDGYVALRLPGQIPKHHAAVVKRCLRVVVSLCGGLYALHEPLSVVHNDVDELVGALTEDSAPEDDILTLAAQSRSLNADAYPRIWESIPRANWILVPRLTPGERRDFFAWFLANIERWLAELGERLAGAVELNWSRESTMRLADWYGAECAAGRVELVHVSPDLERAITDLFGLPTRRLNYVRIEGSEACMTHLMDVYVGESIRRERKAHWALLNVPEYAYFGCISLVKDPRTRKRGEGYQIFGSGTPIVGEYGGPLPRIQVEWIKEFLAETWDKFPPKTGRA